MSAADIIPGDYIIAEHGYVYDEFIVAKVVKIGKVMWEITPLRTDGHVEETVRRKVTGVRKVSEGIDPVELLNKIRKTSAEFRQTIRDTTAAHRASVYALAEDNS
jgi:hypothetical protein